MLTTANAGRGVRDDAGVGEDQRAERRDQRRAAELGAPALLRPPQPERRRREHRRPHPGTGRWAGPGARATCARPAPKTSHRARNRRASRTRRGRERPRRGASTPATATMDAAAAPGPLRTCFYHERSRRQWIGATALLDALHGARRAAASSRARCRGLRGGTGTRAPPSSRSSHPALSAAASPTMGTCFPVPSSPAEPRQHRHAARERPARIRIGWPQHTSPPPRTSSTRRCPHVGIITERHRGAREHPHRRRRARHRASEVQLPSADGTSGRRLPRRQSFDDAARSPELMYALFVSAKTFARVLDAWPGRVPPGTLAIVAASVAVFFSFPTASPSGTSASTPYAVIHLDAALREARHRAPSCIADAFHLLSNMQGVLQDGSFLEHVWTATPRSLARCATLLGLSQCTPGRGLVVAQRRGLATRSSRRREA